jgi:hypothetical protein
MRYVAYLAGSIGGAWAGWIVGLVVAHRAMNAHDRKATARSRPTGATQTA